MSFYLVDMAAVDRVVGSKEADYYNRITADWPPDDDDQDEDDEDFLSEHAALRAVIDGGPYEDQYWSDYLDAYQLICAFFGTPLTEWGTFWISELQPFDEGLAALNMGVRFTDFVSGGTFSADMAGCGEWGPGGCREALRQWESSSAEQRAGLDPVVLERIEKSVEWMREAQLRGDRTIVAFWMG